MAIITLPPASFTTSVLTLRLKPAEASSFDRKKAFDALYAIQEKFERLDDELSCELHEWIDRVLELEASLFDSSLKEKDIQRLSYELLNELYTEVLVDPLFFKPLEQPILEEDGWVWDESILQEFQAICRTLKIDPISPLSEKPFNTLEPHPFALALIAWLHSLPVILPSSHDTLIEVRSTELSHGEITAYKAGGVPSLEFCKRELIALPTLSSLSEADSLVLNAWLKDLSLRAQAEQIKTLEVKMENFQLRALEARRHRENRFLKDELVCMTGALEAASSHAERRIEELAEMARVQHAAHTEMIRAEIGALGAAHTATTTLLRSDISEARRELGCIKGELKEAKAKGVQDEAKIAHLERLYRAKADEVNRLRDEANKDDGGCSVM